MDITVQLALEGKTHAISMDQAKDLRDILSLMVGDEEINVERFKRWPGANQPIWETELWYSGYGSDGAGGRIYTLNLKK